MPGASRSMRSPLAEVLPLAPPWGGQPEGTEGERVSVTLAAGPRLHIRSRTACPSLAYLLFFGPSPTERFMPLLAEGGAVPCPPGSFAEVLVCPGEPLLHLPGAGGCVQVSQAENSAAWVAW